MGGRPKGAESPGKRLVFKKGGNNSKARNGFKESGSRKKVTAVKRKVERGGKSHKEG